MRLLPIIITLIFLDSCQSKRPDLIRESFKESVIKLRYVGLFEDYKGLNDDQLTDTLIIIKIARSRHEFDGYSDFEEVYDPVNNMKWFDLHVAELDDKRVWWHDLESDICKENLVYTQTIKDYEKLSGGYLTAGEIKEEWKSDTGPIEISFWDADTLRVFRPKYNEDWYDIKFFDFLQTAMKYNGSPYKFYMHDQTGQDVFVIRATEDEKQKIEGHMNWKLRQF